MSRAHQEFTREQRKHAENLYKQFKKNQPRMYQEQRAKFIRGIVENTSIKFPISKLILARA